MAKQQMTAKCIHKKITNKFLDICSKKDKNKFDKEEFLESKYNHSYRQRMKRNTKWLIKEEMGEE